MLYLGGDKWVRKGLIKSALGDPPPPGQRGRGQSDPNSPPRVNNGITGDARRSSAALGKMAFDMKVAYSDRGSPIIAKGACLGCAVRKNQKI
jgi:hypothetical protein